MLATVKGVLIGYYLFPNETCFVVLIFYAILMWFFLSDYVNL